MSEFNYLREKARYLNSIGGTRSGCHRSSCKKCMLSLGNNGTRCVCVSFEIQYPEKATEMIRKWSEEHPSVTNIHKFIEVFGSMDMFAKGIIVEMPISWWNEEYIEPEKLKQSRNQVDDSLEELNDEW